MKVLIAADMEGVSGVVDWEQVIPGHAEYDRFRQLMTGDVNAAVRGAFEAVRPKSSSPTGITITATCCSRSLILEPG